MRFRNILPALVIAANSFLFSTQLAAQALPIPDYSVVTDERLINPEDQNWLSYRGTLDGWGYSKLDEIDTDNVTELEPVWSFSTGMLGGHEAPPVVNDGVMFVTTPGNLVYAIDAASGDMLWR